MWIHLNIVMVKYKPIRISETKEKGKEKSLCFMCLSTPLCQIVPEIWAVLHSGVTMQDFLELVCDVCAQYFSFHPTGLTLHYC